MNAASFSSTQTSLVDRVRADDARAWEQFVDLYGPLIFYWARRGGLAGVDAADLTQEAFASIARSIARFDLKNGAGTLRGWMYTIVRNKLRDHYRKGPLEMGGGGSDNLKIVQAWPEQLPESADDATGEEQSRALMRRALGQVEAEFEPRTWSAFWRVVVDGHSTADVAAELGLSQNGVRQAKSRVLRRLREQLGS